MVGRNERRRGHRRGAYPLRARAYALVATLLVAPAIQGQTGAIAGVIIDGGQGQPLTSATVRVEGSDRVATTDASGHFRIDSVPAGTHRLTWRDPVLDSLELAMKSIPFDVPPNGTVKVSLARPSRPAVFTIFCGNTKPGVLATGRVSRVDSDQPIAGATITATGIESGRIVPTKTDLVGRYHLCLSATHAILIRAKRDAEASGYLPPAPMLSVLFSDLRLPAPGENADATLVGQVLADSGRPVNGATVSVLGTSAAATTSGDGRFHLAGLRAGTHVLSVRGVGMDAVMQTIDLSGRSPRTVTVLMRRTPPTLATVNVVASRQQLAETYQKIGFTERQRMGIGRFLTRDEIQRHVPLTTGDALNGMGGITIGDNGEHGNLGELFDAGNISEFHPNTPCTLYVVDGQVLGGEDYATGLPPPAQVIAIEIYRQGEPKPITPPNDADHCAEVLVWTKAKLLQ